MTIGNGPSAFLGVLVGGGLTIGNLLWVARGSDQMLATPGGRPLTMFSLGLRYLALFAALILALWSGRVHPLALAVGVSVLPPVLVLHGLRSARRPS